MLTEQKERESRYLTKKRKVRKRAKKCRRRQKIRAEKRASKIKSKIKKKIRKRLRKRTRGRKWMLTSGRPMLRSLIVSSNSVKDRR